MSKKPEKLPTPLFDTILHIKRQTPIELRSVEFASTDFAAAQSFLLSYDGNNATFNSYRREVERLLQWAWWIANKSILSLRRADIEAYIHFCQSPPLTWIGTKKVPRFIEETNTRQANPEWRPFVVTVNKVAFRNGQAVEPNNYQLSQKALQEIFTVLSSFYNFLIQEEKTEVNPIAHIRQKSRYFRKVQSKRQVRRLSELQWHYVIETAEQMAATRPEQHEKTLFIMTALYAMYLRISELTATPRWIPKMGDFFADHDGLWWFLTVGKGNKERQISVSNAMLAAFKRYRLSLGLSPLPAPGDNTPLIPKLRGKGPISSTNHIRRIVQNCFDAAIIRLQGDGFAEEAAALMQATVHWLRHTGISEDVKHRPREHVRDDAGHSSSATTDKYIDVELRARHESARKKEIKSDTVD